MIFRFTRVLVLTLAFVVPAQAQSAAYSEGLADRTAYETWYNGLGTDEKAGATYWAGQRSLPHPGACGRADTPWDAGCRDAQHQLAATDARRRSEPEYRSGWNVFQPAPPTNTQQAVQLHPQYFQQPPVPLTEQQPMPPSVGVTPLQPNQPTSSSMVNDQLCKDDWKKCKDNSDLVNNFAGYYKVQTACKTKATNQAKYGTPVWPGFWSGGSFNSFRQGTSYISTGVVLAIESDVQFQNGFGAMVHSKAYCEYDLKTESVTNVDIVAR